MNETTNIRASFNPKYIGIVRHFVAKMDIRYYLCGIYVQKAPQGGIYIVGCDGHTMGVAYDASGTIEGADDTLFSVSKGLISAAKAVTGKKCGNLDWKVLIDGKRLRIATGFDAEGPMEHFVQPGHCTLMGKYPKWSTVLPNFANLKRGGLAGNNSIKAEYMARFAQIPGDRWAGLTFWQEESNKALVVQLRHLPEFVGIIMPMHGENDEHQRKLMERFAPPPVD